MRGRADIAAALFLASGAALADGVGGMIEEDYSHSHSTASDAFRSDADQLVQRYRLNAERAFFPNLRLDLGGTFEQLDAWSDTGAGGEHNLGRTASMFSTLNLSGPIYGATAGYALREQGAANAVVPFGFVNQNINLNLYWRPVDLPIFSLRLARPSIWDREHQVQDITSNQAFFAAVWAPIPPLDLRYALDYQNPIDNLHHTNTSSVIQSGRFGYGDRLLGGLSTVALGVNFVNQQNEVTQSGAGGTVSTLLSPLAGLSLVEGPLDTPARDKPVVNAALTNTDVQTSAGINLGPSASLAGDIAFRDLGVQFADAITKANTFWVWVDRQIPQSLAAGLAWTAWTSDDGALWTQIPVVGLPVFNLFQPRFEITVQDATARYLKVVARPLPAGATPDPAFKDILVTELQVLLVGAAPGVHGWQSNSGATVNASARTQIWPNLIAHDISFFGTGGTRPGSTVQKSWVLVNGLGVNKAMTNAFYFNARVARQDADQGHGHESQWNWGGSLAATPLPTFTSSLVYSGRLDQNAFGSSTTSAVSLLAQASPYRGIGFLANAGLGWARLPTGQNSTNDSLALSATLQPHPALTVTSNFAHTDGETSAAGLRLTASRANQVDASLTWNPVPAFYFSGGISHVVSTAAPQTLANGTVNFSPLQGGELQLGLGYQQTLGTDGAITRVFTSSLRWTGRVIILTGGFTAQDTSGGGFGSSHSRIAGVNLRIPL